MLQKEFNFRTRNIFFSKCVVWDIERLFFSLSIMAINLRKDFAGGSLILLTLYWFVFRSFRKEILDIIPSSTFLAIELFLFDKWFLAISDIA